MPYATEAELEAELAKLNLLHVGEAGTRFAAADGASASPAAGQVELAFCVFHHLLEGKAHKKEAEIVQAARKQQMVGLVVYGTPGVVVLQTNVAPEHPNRAKMRSKEFMSQASECGKKGEVKLIALAAAGIGECLRELGTEGVAQVLEEGRGLAPVPVAVLRRLMDDAGCGDRYKEIIGLK